NRASPQRRLEPRNVCRKEASCPKKLALILRLLCILWRTGSGVLVAEVKLSTSVFRAATYFAPFLTGEVAEWSIVPDSKSGVPARVPRVRIPPSPPAFAKPTAGRLASELVGCVEHAV